MLSKMLLTKQSFQIQNDSPVEIDLENLNASDGIKNIIRKEFKHIKDLLDFDVSLMRFSEIGMLMVDFTITK